MKEAGEARVEGQKVGVEVEVAGIQLSPLVVSILLNSLVWSLERQC